MTFPVYLHLGPWTLHPHVVFEFLAYFIGFRVYLYTRRKDRIPVQHAISVLVGATVGAALGSKLLAWFEDPALTWQHLLHDPLALMGGKTIVGGLLGGLIGVELTKKLIGWTRSTGDDFALPLLRHGDRPDRLLPDRAAGPYLRHADRLDDRGGLRRRYSAAPCPAV
ncbi:hypothetical protein J31TS4_18140 [Paenibacillus sp. J31TS4]|uniref:hypothetical protein n=1 Tax=Paenibacillus sp. J31TS4 TaxID=2807195 RepID=UPI001B12B1E5|nr:hypothetical protein [Paenibacillus sp. J31TS4]GIP38534.1 hypothetical protein J31TS4_18140 [Paenibacillus sp. J31TS4]